MSKPLSSTAKTPIEANTTTQAGATMNANNQTVTITESFTTQEAINTLYNLAAQSQAVFMSLEDLTTYRNKTTDHSQIAHFVQLLSNNNGHALEILTQLDDVAMSESVTLPAQEKATDDRDNEILGKVCEVKALAKPLAEWLSALPVNDDCKKLDTDSGDCFVLASTIVNIADDIAGLVQNQSNPHDELKDDIAHLIATRNTAKLREMASAVPDEARLNTLIYSIADKIDREAQP